MSLASLSLTTKYLHVLAAIVMVGTSMANGVMRLEANRSRQRWLIAGASSLIMTLNRRLMVPSLILLPVTGLALALTLGTPLGSGWLLSGEVGTAVLWALFVAGFIVERKMELAAAESPDSSGSFGAAPAAGARAEVPKAYWRAERWGLWIGAVATAVELITLYFMVFRVASSSSQ